MSQGHGFSTSASTLKCELAGEVLRSFGSLRFSATGWSMLPAIWPGDTLFAHRVSCDEVRVGQVVLVGRDGRLCAHRVVSTLKSSGNQHWITQGDAMLAPDRPVNEDQLLGRISYLIRAGKLVAVPEKLSAFESVTANIVRRSVPATRALVFLHNVLQTSRKSTPEKSVLSCQS